jgi:hypothetical protein
MKQSQIWVCDKCRDMGQVDCSTETWPQKCDHCSAWTIYPLSMYHLLRRNGGLERQRP